jgi:molybdenum cofactor biosynthesis enzyme MoaA
VTTSTAVLAEDLQSLHTSYVRAINTAIDSGNDEAVQELAAAHDREKAALLAAHEGGTSSRSGWFRHRR